MGDEPENIRVSRVAAIAVAAAMRVAKAEMPEASERESATHRSHECCIERRYFADRV